MKSETTTSFLFLLLLCTVIWTCVDVIEFEMPESIQKGIGITIQGKLSKGDPSVVNVSIREAFSLNYTPQLISVQAVYLLDQKEQSLELRQRGTGIYQLDIPSNASTFKIDYDMAYKIKLLPVVAIVYAKQIVLHKNQIGG